LFLISPTKKYKIVKKPETGAVPFSLYCLVRTATLTASRLAKVSQSQFTRGLQMHPEHAILKACLFATVNSPHSSYSPTSSTPHDYFAWARELPSPSPTSPPSPVSHDRLSPVTSMNDNISLLRRTINMNLTCKQKSTSRMTLQVLSLNP
jgi:hypothetical protein